MMSRIQSQSNNMEQGLPIYDPDNVYSVSDQTDAHYRWEFVNPKLPRLLKERINDADFSRRTKNILSMLADKLSAHEIMCAKLTREQIIAANAKFNMERLMAEICIDPMDINNPEYAIIDSMLGNHLELLTSRAEGGYERMLQATKIQKVEETIEDKTIQKREGWSSKILNITRR